MISNDTFTSMGNVGPNLIVIDESLLRLSKIKHYLLPRTVGAIHFTAFLDVMPKPHAEGLSHSRADQPFPSPYPQSGTEVKHIARWQTIGADRPSESLNSGFKFPVELLAGVKGLFYNFKG